MGRANSAYLGGAPCPRHGAKHPMPLNDITSLAALRTRMQWHHERQRVLAENIANSDTPNFKPRDLVEPRFDAQGGNASSGAVAGDDPSHLRSEHRGSRSVRRTSDKTAMAAFRPVRPATPSASRTRCSRFRPTRWTMPPRPRSTAAACGLLKTAVGKALTQG